MPTRDNYLETYYNVIPDSKKDLLLRILRDRGTEGVPLNQSIEDLIEKLETPLGEPSMQYRKAGKYGRIGSKDYNDMMRELYLDLGALFNQSNTADAVIIKHEIINKATLSDVRSAIRKIDNDIKVNSILKENENGITDAKYNNFYKDDNGSIDKVFKAWVDTSTKTCKLPKGLDQSVLTSGGLVTANIGLSLKGGGIRGTIESEDNRKERAIDGNRKTFWSEVILTDEPIQQTYDDATVYGTVCEVTISFIRKELINHIMLDPFINYPLKVLKIKYRANTIDSWTDLGVDVTESTSAMEYNFAEVEAQEIMIVINQENPTLNTYKIPQSVISNAEMWQQIADRELSVSNSLTSPIQATQDMIDYVTGWQAYTNALELYNKTVKKIGSEGDTVNNIGEIIFDSTTEQMCIAGEEDCSPLKLDLYGEKPNNEDKLISVRKYEYLYGMYEIDIKRLWYADQGEYISPKYITTGAILEAEIDASETLGSGVSVEYSLSTNGRTWKTVMPSGNYVIKERLDVDPITKAGVLRLPATAIDAVYRNDALMGSYLYEFDDDTDSVTVASGSYVGSAAYTVSYTPTGVTDATPSGIVVDFSSDPLILSEDVFELGASRNYKVALSHNPYVNYNVINNTTQAAVPSGSAGFSYLNGRWQNVSGDTLNGVANNGYYDVFTVTVDGYGAENRTDYYNDIRPALTQYDRVGYPYYEYFHVGKSLYFNTVTSDKEIRAKYYYINDFIQLRALLRNNDTSSVMKTPILSDYTIKLRTS